MKFRARRPAIGRLRAVRLVAIGIGLFVLFTVGGAREMVETMWATGKAGVTIYREAAGQQASQATTAGPEK